MMDAMEREQALRAMRSSADAFYRSAVQIGVHPFIEFAGLMNEYLLACAQAHAQGIDFSECNRHSGQALLQHPVAPGDERLHQREARMHLLGRQGAERVGNTGACTRAGVR